MRRTPRLGVAVEFEKGREEAALPAFALEVGLGAAVDLDGGEGPVGQELAEKRLALRAVARRQACAQVHLATGAVNRLTVEAPVAGGQGVELDDLAGGCGFASLGRSPGVGAEAFHGFTIDSTNL